MNPVPPHHAPRADDLRRLAVLLLLVLALAFAPVLGFEGLVPSRGGLALAGEFLSHALSPAFEHEATFVPADAPPLLVTALRAALRTLVFAAAAMSLAIPAGLLFGFLICRAAREGLGFDRRPRFAVAARLAAAPLRLLMVLLRSVHELLWAVLLLTAFGLTPLAGVLALAIPYAATLAKVYAELLDESSPRAAHALDGLGARPFAAFLHGRLPAALPDITTYTFYRFECCVRASAVLGFFGFTTLGFYLSASFENVHFGEVWTYLYILIALVLLLEGIGRGLRRRMVV